MLKNVILNLKLILRKYAFRKVLSQSQVKLCNLFNKLNGIFFSSPVKLSWLEESNHYRIQDMEFKDQTFEIFNSRKERLPLYFSGIAHRVQSLANKYFLADLDINNGDVIIDCGANVGELGKYFQMEGIEVAYHAFDPSEQETVSAQLNNPKGFIQTAGLWKKTGKLPLFEKNETADSSFIEFKGHHSTIEIDVITLDDYIMKNKIESVKLLKLEAEGAEPEILEGAKKVINRIQWISADCGPERGLSKDMTFKPVMNFLVQNGFEIEALNPKKSVVLLKNKLF